MGYVSRGQDQGDYEVGYGKPPEDRQFKKGVSGNPTGRPKKPLDFGSELDRELKSKLIINENGKRKVITKSVGFKRQAVNKAVSGNLQAIRLLGNWIQQAQVGAAELQQNSPHMPDYEHRKAADFTDDELALIIQGIHPKYANRKLD